MPSSSSLPATGVVNPVSAELRAVIDAFVGDRPIRVELWDGSSTGPSDSPVTLKLLSPSALARMMWMPNELGIARAFVAGELAVDGDLFEALTTLKGAIARSRQSWADLARHVLVANRRLGLLGRPPRPPAEEATLSGWRHSLGRDTEAVTHHYDVGNDFYRLVLGSAMTYSCARFISPSSTLEQAQTDKHELICRKLGLADRPGMRLLDVGCGWGSMALHAAQRHHARVVGITLSEPQAVEARRRAAQIGLGDKIEIRVQDYRDLGGERFDAISSIGMSEHVGAKNLATYFETLHGLLGPHGRLLNHAISSVGGSKMGRFSFIGRYVFPDGELIDVGETVLAMERAGFEVRDVESLREHYALTLRRWVSNLEQNWDRAVELVGVGRARVWRLYMAASAVGFDDGGIAIHQVLGVQPDGDGGSAMPSTRRAWESE